MRDRQTATCMNYSRLFKLKKVDDRCNCEGVEFPASYEPISAFEEINEVCIFIFEFDSEGQIILGQRGRHEHLTDDLIHSLRMEAANNGHYIYSKTLTDHFFRLQNNIRDKDTRFCPRCAKR